MQVLGPDTQMFYYTFYPTNPFVQTGSATQPIVYWLAAYAVVPTNCDLLFGWKTTITSWNDAPVWGHWMHGQGVPVGDWKAIEGAAAPLPGLAFKLTTPQSPTPTNCVRVICPTNMTVNCAGPNGAVVNYQAYATNDCTGGVLPVTCVPPSGSFFPPGATQVCCTNITPPFTNFCCFQVTVNRDINPPVITCPANLTLNADPGTCAKSNVTFTATATDDCPPITVSCTPPSGSTFPVGVTTVTCMATDAAGLSANCTFTVTIIGTLPPPPPPPPTETNAVKWVQWPNPNGFDVLDCQQIVLADDFLCTNRGPITDIHLWTSWLRDRWSTNIPIWLGLFSDVPKTNANFPSHPGQMLWQQWFGPTDYQIYLAGTASEQFLDPQAMQVLGPDTQMFYYSFYPTNPFVQTGSATQPIVYWLAAYAVVPTNCDLLFGWKTTLTNWNDAPVWGHWMHGQALPLGDWKAIEEALAPLPGLAFKLTTTAPPPPVPTNKVYIQPPDLTTNGLDVRATVPTMLADDFPCTNAGPITNIVIWASWLDDKPNLQARIQLAFWTDVPRTNTFYPSHPGQRLWTDWFAPGTVGASVPGTYEMRPFQTANERFFDPNLAGMNGLIGGDKTVWQINFFPRRAFWQTGTVAQPTVYWLSMAARTTTNTLLLGWKTSQTHWNDDGVFGHVLSSGLPLNDWRELRDPRTSNSLDLSFALLTGASTTTNNPNPDQNLLIKFRQPPDVTDRGLDVRASGLKILADDFYCWRAGRIRGVSVWGSWLNDVVDPNAAFLLGLWSDVPATRTNASHPGSLLASTWFYPPGSTNSAVSRYRYQLEAANLHEQFFDPNVPGIVGNDTQLWRYDFYPSATNWHQTGSPFQRKVYWLSVAAKTTNDTVFGWKTSPMHYNDDAVFGHVNSQWQPQRDWQELRDPRTSNSLDLAFAIKTYRPYALNADFTNTTGKAATSFDVLLSGVHEVIAHFDGYPGAVWPSFRVLYVNGNTLLRWSGLTVPPRGWTHLGFVVTDDAVNPVTMRGWWWDPDGEIIGSPPQVNLVRGNQTLTLWNDVLDPPEPVLIGGLSIEYHETDVPLDDLNPLAASNRHPVRVDEILPPGAAMPIPGGGSLTLPVPVPPERAAYAVHVFQVRSTGTATEGVTTDFIQTPTDWAAMPVIHSAQWSDGVTELTWDTVVGRTYRVQYRDQINESIWHDLPGDVTAEEEVSSFFDVFLTLPSQRHYRILLLP
ncbi:MAG: HYR domain-containing protein [Verrucomicrobia bacterium]|nr:HYR domain-containing protein [Verrucomicrobiota bacterium]